METPAGPAPRVGSRLSRADHLGTFKVRWGMRRHDYAVAPGLYALGSPGPDSPVLASANYKLSFDHLRAACPGLDAWLLVLDTNGINVWCAAGKGAMGTAELVKRMDQARLDQVVSHRKIILPQLAAPGVAAHEVKRLTGFRVVYGPVRAQDLPAFLEAGRRASPEMRRVSFTTGQRAVLIPVELVGALRVYAWLLPAVVAVAGLAGLLGGPGFWAGVAGPGLRAAAALLLALAGGAILGPLLLPWLPGRAFALKGLWPGLAGALALWALWPHPAWPPGAELGAWLLAVPALSSFMTMNFTGASTYTSLSGVKKEMRRAVPPQIAAASAGLLLWLFAVFFA
ncbi:MAG: hypothetical protein K9K66_12820 [Desulfarculaceae bacterium]|nr:hypothetical protein [Desulfarculaceae bacterium]MCF8072653.1 hypothetical protein [Desulfarculaceae bacterium]MCF8102532.1 hypothetical protein [Desulfarculaceae bacterium]MCF8116441.1 hypothetical protein [Desulfarculaceae bacterium]